MWRYNTYVDWAVVLRPIISVCLHFVDGKASLGRAAEVEVKVAIYSQSIPSLLAFCRRRINHAWQAVLDATWRICGRTISSRITVLIGSGTLDELAKQDLCISSGITDIT